MQKVALTAMKKAILIISAMIVVWLVYLAGFSTAIVSITEKVYMVSDSFVKNMIFPLTLIGISTFFYTKTNTIKRFIDHINTDKEFSDRVRKVLLICLLCIGIFLVVVLRQKPCVDQLFICDAAKEWMDHNYSSLIPGGYIDIWGHQKGITNFLFVLWHIVGADNYLFFQIINVVSLVWAYKALVVISDISENSNFTGLVILIMSICFFPALMYTTFVYGTLIGFAFSVNATKHILFFDKTGKYGNFIFVIVFSFFALVFKSNYMIFLLGNMILILILTLKKNEAKKILLMLALLIVLLSTGRVSSALTTRITGVESRSGSSLWAHIAMGMQENEDRYNGWWNGYNENTYKSNEYDTESQTAEVKEEIKERLQEFKDDPSLAVKFFAGKEASQWNNPDYEAWWVNHVMFSDKRAPLLIWQFLSSYGFSKITWFFNYLQFIYIFGVILYFLYSVKKKDVYISFCATIIGGFLFHMFWEGKSQYILPYFLLLIPLSAIGYVDAVKLLSGAIGNKDTFTKSVGIPLMVFIAIGVIIYYSPSGIVRTVFIGDSDDEAYEKYVDSRMCLRLSNGEYIISSNSNHILNDDDNNQTVYIRYSSFDDYLCIFSAEELYLTTNTDSGKVYWSTEDFSEAQRWRIKPADNGKIHIVASNNKLLTDNNDELTLNSIDIASDQEWSIVSVGR